MNRDGDAGHRHSCCIAVWTGWRFGDATPDAPMLDQFHILGRYRSASPEDRVLAIPQASRYQHTHVIGQTGTGKSTFAKQSFMQDILAGHGGCYFDFHGQDAPWFLDRIPPERIKDVIYFNPLDADHAIGYNVLDGVAPEDHATFTDEIVATLRHIHHASWGARMDDILTNAIRPLFDLPPESKGTMLGVVRMLNDVHYRNWVVRQCREHTVRDFWQREYAEWSKPDKAHNLNSSLNKIRRFQSSPVLRRILGQQRSRIDLRRAIASGQIVICDINKWRMGAVNANTLASLIVSRLIYEATRRDLPRRTDGEIAEEAIIPFSVVIDEFQTVTTLSAIEAFTGIRKFRVAITVLHQYTAQLSPALLDAVNGNVGNRIVFRVGGEDAIHLQRHMDIPKISDLTDLDDYHFIAQYKEDTNTRTRRAYTERIDFPTHGHSTAVRALMRSKFAVPVEQIEAQYARWQCSRHFGGPLRLEATKCRGRSRTRMRSVGELLR